VKAALFKDAVEVAEQIALQESPHTNFGTVSDAMARERPTDESLRRAGPRVDLRERAANPAIRPIAGL
jgi:hypothetical protein